MGEDHIFCHYSFPPFTDIILIFLRVIPCCFLRTKTFQKGSLSLSDPRPPHTRVVNFQKSLMNFLFFFDRLVYGRFCRIVNGICRLEMFKFYFLSHLQS